MPYTIGQCVAEARTILQDQVTPYRYDDASIYNIFTSAMFEARRLRPDLFLSRLFEDLPLYTVADADKPFPISTLYSVAVINYLVGRAELRDDEFNSDGRANAMLTSLKAQLSTATA